MKQKKTIEEIKAMYPGLELIADGPYDYSVGYPEPGDLFNVQGTGDNPDEAWQDAYMCLTNTGPYSKEVKESVACKISIDKNVDGTYFLYIHDNDDSEDVISCIEINEISAQRLVADTKLYIGEFPF